jgi:ribosome biogenesis ATPase
MLKVNEASLLAVSRAANSLVGAATAAIATAVEGDGHAVAVSLAVETADEAAAFAATVAAGSVSEGNGTVSTLGDAMESEAVTPGLSMQFNTGLKQDGSANDKTSLEERAISSTRIREQVHPFTPTQMDKLYVTLEDFEAALPRVQPASKREGFATVPEVSWDDVGALAGPRRELEDAAVLPLTNPELCRLVGIPRPPGVLLYGPPGCGKTLLAKAVANGSHVQCLFCVRIHVARQCYWIPYLLLA